MRYKHAYFHAMLATFCILASPSASAEILPDAEVVIKIPLIQNPSTRPMTVAYVPHVNMYYIADGGLAPMGSETEAPVSKSKVHAYNAQGKHINSAQPGYDNRSIYFNPNTGNLETVTYNVSSAVGFFPNTGIYALHISETGEIRHTSDEIMQFNPAFGDAGTMPCYEASTKRYFAKQGRSNLVWVVDPKQREKVAEIALDFKRAQVNNDDVADYFVACTGVAGHELVLLDIDHKAALVFDLTGKYIGKSALPSTMKLRAKNHYSGLGYANAMLFVYHEGEGEFGTYYGLRVVK